MTQTEKCKLQEKMDHRSDKETRLYKQVPKNHNFSKSVTNSRIDRLRCLLDRKLVIRVSGDSTERNPVKRTVTIEKLYPHMALASYAVGPEHKTRKIYVGLSAADLVEAGIITYIHGFPEVRNV